VVFVVQVSLINEQLESIKNLSSQEKQIIAVLEAYKDCFPVLDAKLCRYSPIGYLAEGIISLEQNQIKYIHDLRFDIRTLPTIMTAINEKEAKHYRDRELFEKTSSNYVIDSEITSFLVTPIVSRSLVIGIIYSERPVEDAEFNEELLANITAFGRQVGLILQSSIHNETQQLLSKRELQVLTKISSGKTTKEIAVFLGISEHTVKDYVKMGLKKLNATNRTHAVAELFRKGILP